MLLRHTFLLTALAVVLLTSGCHRQRLNLRHKWAPAGSCCEPVGCSSCCSSPTCPSCAP